MRHCPGAEIPPLARRAAGGWQKAGKGQGTGHAGEPNPVQGQ